MKSILFFFLICFEATFAQDYTSEELVIPFEWHPESMRFELVDENYSPDNILDGSWVHTAELPYSGTEITLFHTRFYRTGNRFLEFSQYPGNRFFFQEWSDSLRSDLLHFGEVEVDIESLEMREVTLTSMEGEDSLGFDLFYTFQKVGPWEFRLPDNSKLYGNYEYGKRAGTWTNYLNTPLASSTFLPVLSNFEYEHGVLTATTLVDKSGLSNNEKLKLLNGKWKGSIMDAKGVALYKQGYRVLKFTKEEKAEFPCSNHFMGSIACGTIAERNPLKWTVNKDNTISIDGSTYTILYLTEEQLLLRVEE